MEKEYRQIKVTVRFTASEMERIKEMLRERSKGKGITGRSTEQSLSEFFREKILILNRSLELRKIRLELTEINTKLGQIRMYLSRKGGDASEAFAVEVFEDLLKRIREVLMKLEEET